MKKYFILLSVAFLYAISSFGQQNRMVLWEQFTNTGCGPCAGFNPQAEAYWEANADKVIPISFHVSWPSGADPMYQNNTAENNWRTQFYGVNGVPFTVINGSKAATNINVINNRINTELAKTPKFDIELSHELNATQTEVTVNMTVTANEAMSGNFLAHIVVLEKVIDFANPPGGNGETHFVNVMKKFLPGKNGNPLPASMAAGESIDFTQTWTVTGFYNATYLSVAAFVQESPNKYVHQAAFSAPVAPEYNDVILSGFEIPTNTFCGSGLEPVLKVKNDGADLQSFDVAYTLNGGEEMVYHFEGEIPFLRTATVTLPAISSDGVNASDNVVSATISNPNGGEDMHPENNTKETSFDVVEVNQRVFMTAMLGKYASELSWKLFDYNGNILKQASYTDANNFNTVRDTFDFPLTGCYKMVWYDSYGDGFNNGGWCKLQAEGGEQFAYINHFKSEVTVNWHAEGAETLNPPTNFTGNVNGSDINFSWEAPAKSTLTGFNIWNSINATTPVNGTPIPASDNSYSFTPAEEGVYSFYVSAIYDNGESEKVGPVNIRFFEGVDEQMTNLNFLAYPNPANDVLNVQYSLDEQAQVEMDILDLTGKRIELIESGAKAAGQQQYAISINKLHQGIYFLRIQVNGKPMTQKIVKL